TSVVPGSPAEKAGFKVNDIVIEFAGKPVSDNPDDLSRRVFDAKPNEKVNAVVLRKGKKVEIAGIELPEVKNVAPRLDLPPQLPPLPDLKLPDLPDLPVPNARPVPLPIKPKLPSALPDRGPRPGGVGLNGLNGRNGSSFGVTTVNGQVLIK